MNIVGEVTIFRTLFPRSDHIICRPDTFFGALKWNSVKWSFSTGSIFLFRFYKETDNLPDNSRLVYSSLKLRKGYLKVFSILISIVVYVSFLYRERDYVSRILLK